jgi:hypothetical protein
MQRMQSRNSLFGRYKNYVIYVSVSTTCGETYSDREAEWWTLCMMHGERKAS